jgi:hypothetical protein
MFVVFAFVPPPPMLPLILHCSPPLIRDKQLLEEALRDVQHRANRPTSAGRVGSPSVTFGVPARDSKDALLDEALSGLKQMGWGASNSFAARGASPIAASVSQSSVTKSRLAVDPLEQLISATVPSVNGMSFATMTSSSWQAELDRLVAASA